MKILLLASSAEEIAATISYLEKNWTKKSFWEYKKNDVSIFTLVSGLGGIFSVLALCRYPEINEIDYIINPGLGAALTRTLDLGKVYLIEEESFGDIGLEESDSTFNDLHDLGWFDKNTYPFLKGKLFPKTRINPTFLTTCTSITVNKIPGTIQSIEQFTRKYHKDMMTLDGAAILYAVRMLDAELIQYRVVSRNIEPWQIKPGHIDEYIETLNLETIKIINALVPDNSSI